MFFTAWWYFYHRDRRAYFGLVGLSSHIKRVPKEWTFLVDPVHDSQENFLKFPTSEIAGNAFLSINPNNILSNLFVVISVSVMSSAVPVSIRIFLYSVLYPGSYTGWWCDGCVRTYRTGLTANFIFSLYAPYRNQRCSQTARWCFLKSSRTEQIVLGNFFIEQLLAF